MAKVFISHSIKDREFVESEIVAVFHGSGIETWYAREDVHSAEQWERAILKGLKSCEWFLVAMSPDSAESEWVRNEVSWAMGNRAGKIVPVFIRNCRAEDFHLGLPRIQYVDLRRPTQKAKESLLTTFRKTASTANPGTSSHAGAVESNPDLLDAPQVAFHCGHWVPPEFFIGREEELLEARRLIETRQNFLIVGRPRAGKTSFCQKLAYDLANRPDRRLLASYMNLEQGSQMTIEAFLEHTILNIIGEMARKLFGGRYSDLMGRDPTAGNPELVGDGQFQRFVNIFKLVTQFTHQKKGARPKRLSPDDFVRFTNELLEICVERRRAYFVMFYDEANRLPRDISIDLLNNIGEALNRTGVIGVYAASLEMAEYFDQLPGLFGRNIPLGPFGSSDDMCRLLARYYFDDDTRVGELPVTEEALGELWELSGGRPYPIQLISESMFQVARNVGSAKVELEHARAAHEAAAKERPKAFES